MPYLGWTIARGDLAFICVLSDLAIVVSLYLSLLLLRSFQSKAVNDVQESLLTADDFCIAIRDLPPGRNVNELKAHLW